MLRPLKTEYFTDESTEIFGLERLPKCVRDTKLLHPVESLAIRLCGDDNNCDVFEVIALAEFACEFLAIHDGHVEVEEHEIDPDGLEHLKCFDAVSCFENAVFANSSEFHDLLDRGSENR